MIIIKAILVMGLLGAGFAIFLTIASRIFTVKGDERKILLLGILPGTNCGACGFPGCSGMADALLANKADITRCMILSQEKRETLGRLLGIEIKRQERLVALIACGGVEEKTVKKYIYSGIKDCRAVQLVADGDKACSYGCLGYNTCVDSCPFGAITPNLEGNPPYIDPAKCTGCGLCVKMCPRGVIKLIPATDLNRVVILCNSRDKGAQVNKVCKVGCIACRLCVNICPENAITIINNLATIDYSKCNGCGLCIKECPTGVIKRISV